MARSVATASVSFGLVAIPVKLYPATDPSSSVRFHMLDGETKSRVKQQYIRPADGVVVPRSEMVKGYEFAKGQYVTFTSEELKALEEKANQSIEIAEFVPLDQIDPIHFDKPYYLGPEKGGEKAYTLLSAVMKETGRCAIARYAARGKQYLVLLRPTASPNAGLLMQQLLYATEIRSFSEIPVPDVEFKPGELELARQLVDQIASQTFDPSPYKDDVRERILSNIQRKVDGHEIAATDDSQTPAQIIDLMDALKRSLESVERAGSSHAEEAMAAKNPDEANGASAKTKKKAPRRRPAKRASASVAAETTGHNKASSAKDKRGQKRRARAH